jgi:hypothetical protein
LAAARSCLTDRLLNDLLIVEVLSIVWPEKSIGINWQWYG